MRGTLVIGQLAPSTIILAGALLLVRVVFDLKRVRLGFDPQDLHAVSFHGRDLNAAQSPDRLVAFAAMIRDMAERQIGSRDVTIAATVTTGMAFASALEARDRAGAIAAPRPSPHAVVIQQQPLAHRQLTM